MAEFPSIDTDLLRTFAAIADRWGALDFLIHAIAFSDKNELTGRFINTSRENFRNSLTISCYSLIDLARRAQPLMRNGGSIVTLTYAGGVALAALAGVLAAPIYSVNPQMGSSLIITVFAVVVIGGMGSIMGSILTGLALGVIEGLTKVFWPEASSTVVFFIMVIVLLIRPAGLFGKEK